MRLQTRFTQLVGCPLPVQLAALGGVGTTELAAAVVGAGGCGMVPARAEPVGGACGVNFLVPFAPSLEVIEETATRARIVEFFYGSPRVDVVAAVHAGGALAGWQVGSAGEAAAAQAAGCDYVVAQGLEAGGHVRGIETLDEVLLQVLATVRIPVVAAGGVATSKRLAELMRAGDDAVRVGTRFVASPESDAHPVYVRRLLEARAEDTMLTEWFGKGWENAPHRVLRSAVAAARRSGWRAATPPNRGVGRSVRDMALYAGTGVGEVRASEPAARVVADLVSEL